MAEFSRWRRADDGLGPLGLFEPIETRVLRTVSPLGRSEFFSVLNKAVGSLDITQDRELDYAATISDAEVLRTVCVLFVGDLQDRAEDDCKALCEV
ncbi:hypothetical protein AVEN_246472-1 [Araneus ventricosus]|uniref:Uncharacterized protein n=1 Tax=Araneus ventricosus TaxID=182803 RepID=A0A4Y2WEB8_ARAVE|nr:hypothetical protein AVEN_246472-1 [Araneus ventricosus]